MAQLAARRNALVCTPDGIFILSGHALVERRGAIFTRASQQEICNLVASLYGAEVVYGPLFPTIERAARFLERGLCPQANEVIGKLELPFLTARGEHLMRIAPGFFDPDKHPRWPAGQSDGGRFRPADGGGDINDLPKILPVADFSGGFHDAVVKAEIGGDGDAAAGRGGEDQPARHAATPEIHRVAAWALRDAIEIDMAHDSRALQLIVV